MVRRIFIKRQLQKAVQKILVNKVLKNAKFLPNVIKYDRYQPECHEDTQTYIGKRATNKKLKRSKFI